MRRIVWLAVIFCSLAAPLAGQQAAPPDADMPGWLRVILFLVSLPYTLYRVFVDGGQMHLLPAPLIAIALAGWSFLEWRRQRYWTPRLVHVMAGLALMTIIAINVDWVMAGGEMWTQRYVVIAVFGIFPYVAYLLFLGPRHIGRKRAPRYDDDLSDAESTAWKEPAPEFVAPSPEWVAPPRRPLRPASIAAWVALCCAGAVALVLGPEGLGFGPDWEGLEDPQAVVRMVHGVSRGAPGADVTISVFADYQCPACATFATEELPRIDAEYIATGKARIVYYDSPITSMHPHAFLASRATHCAEDQGAFWPFHDILFEEQETWSALTDAAPAFEEYAREVGVNGDEFRACLESERYTDVVEANDAFGAAIGVRATPTVLIQVDGGKTRKARSFQYASVVRTIERVIASANR